VITKLLKDHVVKQSPMCGELREILIGAEYSPNVAMAMEILPTEAHYHESFDEIYFVLDGYIQLRIYDPDTAKVTEQTLSANELCVISKGIHHGITESSTENRLGVISVPQYKASDQHSSDKF
jgi:mannose-6-phosphate isomerase-like protein (cupin superfamily)